MLDNKNCRYINACLYTIQPYFCQYHICYHFFCNLMQLVRLLTFWDPTKSGATREELSHNIHMYSARQTLPINKLHTKRSPAASLI